jgi:probable phosphoglycerate mutase
LHIDLILVRHAEAIDDREDIVDGFSDFELTALGRRQSQLIAKRLARDFEVEKLFCGNSKRTIETAEIISETLKLPVQLLTGLKPFNIGLDRGITQEEASRKYPHVWCQPLDVHECLPGGEPYSTFHERATTVLMDLLNENQQHFLCVVTHGLVINAFYRHFCRHSMEQWHDLSIKTSIASLHQFSFRNEATFRKAIRRIVRLNDTSHLREFSQEP